MNPAADIRGTHRALYTVSDIDTFEQWIEANQQDTIENYLEGYRMLVRACLQSFQDKLTSFPKTFHIKQNQEFRRARGEIADIDSLQANSEAANLIKYIDRLDNQIHSAHNVEYLKQSILDLKEQLLDPFEEVFANRAEYHSQSSDEEVDKYLACFWLMTCANEAARGYPKGYQYGWMDFRWDRSDFDANFDTYKTALLWAYSVLEPDKGDFDTLSGHLISSEDWKELDSQFSVVRDTLLRPFEDEMEATRDSLIELELKETPKEIEHLLSGFEDPAVGIEKRLDRFFLWQYASKANEVLMASGTSGIFVILFGLMRIRNEEDTGEPIQFRRFKHPTKPGNDYSYAIDMTGWGLESTGSLHGWAVFTHAATDYSGFGGSQLKIIENYVSDLEERGAIEVQEMVIEEEILEDYLSESSPRPVPNSSGASQDDRMYDGREVSTIIRGGEDDKTEFKEEIPEGSLDKLGTEIVALANHNGGILLLGVDDDGKIVGIDDPDSLDNRISGHLRTKCRPPLTAEIHVESAMDDKILVVDIPDVEKPVAIDYTYYIRTGRNKRRMLYDEIKNKFE